MNRIILILVASFIASEVSLAQVNDATERQALQDIYNGMGGTGWNNQWTQAAITNYPNSTLYGVTIVNNDITIINLDGNGLNGSIPTSISGLTALTELHMRNGLTVGGSSSWPNKISGTLPSLAGLVNLKILDLQQNFLTGTIGSWIGTLTNLEYLDLSSKIDAPYGPYLYLTGPLPTEIGNLIKLKTLYLDGNDLSSGFPSSFANLSSLSSLSLSNSRIGSSSISILMNLTALTYLNLATGNGFENNNSITTIPTNISQLVNLQNLSLYGNQNLDTNSLGNVAGVTSLQLLNVAYCNLASVPSNLSNLVNLRSLYVNNNHLTGLPSTYSSLTSLQNLYAGGNKTITDLPTSFSNLNNLQTLDLSDNNLSTMPTCIPLMTSLVTLNLSINHILGPLPSNFGSNSSSTLKNLYLGTNNIGSDGTVTVSVPFAPSFYNFVNLEILDISFNNIGSATVAVSLPSNFGVFTHLTNLSINNNNFSGPLPSSLSSLTALHHFYAQHNSFVSPIPAGLMPGLSSGNSDLNLSYNSFTGSFPSYLTTVYNGTVDISHNSFDGFSSPTQSNYSVFNISYNQLDFGDIEPCFFYNNDAYNGKTYHQVVLYPGSLTYSPQNLTTVGTAQTVEVVEATTLTLQNLPMAPATHNLYEWQKWDGTTWNSVQAASANNYVVPNVTAAVGGIYQMKITNSWVPNLTYYSAPITVVVLPPLCDSYIPAMAGSFKMDKVTGAIVFDRNDCTQDIPLTCLYGPAQNVNNVVSASASLFTDNWDDGIATNNPFQTGEREWRQKSAFSFNTKINYQSNSANLSAGVFSYKPFNWTGVDGSQPAWLKATDIEKYSADGEPVQERNALKIPSATRFGYDGSVPYLIVQNAEYDNVVFESFEKTYGTGSNLSLEDNITLNGITLSSTAHSGVSSLPLTGSFSFRTLTTKGKDVTVRFWLTGDVSAGNVAVAATSGVTSTPTKIATSGLWSLWESTITGPGSSVTVSLTKGNGGSVYVDDVRLQPVDAEMTCYVYDPRTLRLLAVFDDRHFGMYYQYSEEGKLVRKMIETEKGIKTIQETQYNLPTQTK